MDQKLLNDCPNFPYMSIAIALIQKVTNDDYSVSYKLMSFDEFECQRDLQAQFSIEQKGTYIILPITTGCSFVSPLACFGSKKIPNHKPAFIIDKNCKLTPLAKITLRKIFERLDSVQIDNRLETGELKKFFERFEDKMTLQNQKKLSQRISSIKALSCDQFLLFV